MLRTRIEIDLPGVDVLRGMGPVEWVRSLFGEPIDLRTGQQRTTVSAFSLLEGLYRGFRRAGITDAVSFLVDRRAIYVDTQEVTHDLDLVWKAAQERGVLERPFEEMHLVLTRHQAGLHLLFDLRLTAKVMSGEPHLTIDVSGRPEELRIRRGESAQEYHLRIQEITRNEGGPEAYLAAMDAIATDLADALQRDVPGARTEVVGARVQIVKPGARELGRFRQLRFGEEVTTPTYRPVPSRTHRGAYADPFVHYWYDPYWDLTHWMLLSSMMHHHWHTPDVVVVDSSGATLFDGAHPDPALLGGVVDPVEIGADGVHVDASVPEASTWGGDDLASSDSWGASDTSDASGTSDSWGDGGGSDAGDAGGSSCGSSCGGSSCGSGCGGGGD